MQDKTLGNSKKPYIKKDLSKGKGVRYYNNQSGSWELNYGYDKPIYGGGDGIHTAPYLKTSVNTSKGTVKVHIPLK